MAPGPAAGDAGVRGVLREAGCVAAALHAFERFGRYTANEKAWLGVTQQLLTEGHKELSTMEPHDLRRLIQIFVEDVRVTRATFWAEITDKVLPVLESAKLEDLVELAELYTKIQAWQRPVFSATIRKVRTEMAIHSMEPPKVVRLLAIFGRAGTGSQELSSLATPLFNEVEDRVLEDAADFDVEDCVGLLTSMALFRAVNVPVLKQLGTQHLHGALSEGQLHGPTAAKICRAYGELGWRHDTVFRNVVKEVLGEHAQWQRARVLGETLPLVRYSASDIAMVSLAMLQLKMYRGNTSWFKWGERYRELLDLLMRRLEAELPSMEAEALAGTAFVLGRARRGSAQLHKALYARMTHLLEGAADAMEPPQDHLERFLHGLAMMGPDRKKDLDAEWLMQWLCNNVYTFVLSDFILVNRHLVMMGCYDREYLQMLVPFYCDPDRMKQLSKSDVMELTHTYNGARIREEDMPDGLGRHFFWALGRRFQRLQVEASRGRRPTLRRVG